MPGRLSIVATPIGNLEDITMRALRTLRECDVILCEDTRVTAKLLARHDIQKPLHRLDQHIQKKTSGFFFVLELLREGKKIAYVTDAGTPGLSDPGNVFVARVAIELPDVHIEPIPGPSALTALASVCGLPTDRFLFLGFLPLKKHRKAYLKRIAESEETVIFYESPHRILKTLRELIPLAGNRPIVVGRELTKFHETVYRGTIINVIMQLERGSTKGEFVIAVASVQR